MAPKATHYPCVFYPYSYLLWFSAKNAPSQVRKFYLFPNTQLHLPCGVAIPPATWDAFLTSGLHVQSVFASKLR